MNFTPGVIEGSVMDLPIDPTVALKWVTHRIHGPPMDRPKYDHAPFEKPKDLGEERHMELLKAIKGLKPMSQMSNVADALQQYRDWRR